MSPRILLLNSTFPVAVPAELRAECRQAGVRLRVLSTADIEESGGPRFLFEETMPVAESALAMAVFAYQRARERHRAAHDEIVGLGMHHASRTTAGGPGEIECCCASQTLSQTRLDSLVLSGGAAGSRAVGDVARCLLIRAVADVYSLDIDCDPPRFDDVQSTTVQERAPEALVDVWSGTRPVVWYESDGHSPTSPIGSPAGVLSGAFNPLHAGHIALGDVARSCLQGPVVFELSLRNADKPPLDYLTLKRRLRQFRSQPVALTNAPTFSEKAAILPGTTFVVGVDTAARIVQPVFYHGRESLMREALCQIRDAGCSFLVAGRTLADQFQTLDDLNLPDEFAGLFTQLPAELFRMDISSSQHRRLRNS